MYSAGSKRDCLPYNAPRGRERSFENTMALKLRWGIKLLGAGVFTLLVGCADGPTRSPERIAYPRGTPSGDADPTAKTDPNAPPRTPVLPAVPIDESLFGPVRDALGRGDWVAAHLALPASPATTGAAAAQVLAPQSPTDLWIQYYAARISHLRGDLPSYQRTLGELLQTPLPEDLAREVSHHRLERAEHLGDARGEFQEARRLLDLGGHAERPVDDCKQALWRAAQVLAGSPTAASISGDPESRAWLELAQVARRSAPRDTASAASAWLATYPEHPALEFASALRDGALRDATSERLALTLPLSGPLAAAGDAVARGFLAAFYADQSSDTAVEVIDSRRYASVGEALNEARNRGTSIVVGPLGKLQVAEVIAATDSTLPILTLNRPEQADARAAVLQLSLAPEDEARQLAEQAFADGARRALLIRPEGAWGDRIAGALGSAWNSLGGTTPATASFASPSAYSETIRTALALDESGERAGELRSLFSEDFETVGRRRQDLDAVFLMTRSGDEARALKPLIDYHYAGDLDVYALSTADSGGQNRNRDRDLEGVRLLVMPWRLTPNRVPGLEDRTGGSYDALHALGADAYRLAQHWWRVNSDAQPQFRGLTADLQREATGVLTRRLVAAEFNRGILTAR